jgi:hypothetical protein
MFESEIGGLFALEELLQVRESLHGDIVALRLYLTPDRSRRAITLTSVVNDSMTTSPCSLPCLARRQSASNRCDLHLGATIAAAGMEMTKKFSSLHDRGGLIFSSIFMWKVSR